MNLINTTFYYNNLLKYDTYDISIIGKTIIYPITILWRNNYHRSYFLQLNIKHNYLQPITINHNSCLFIYLNITGQPKKQVRIV